MFQKLLLALAAALPVLGEGCTDFILSAADKTQVVGRSLEFAQILPTSLKVFPKGETTQSIAPNSKQGLKWTSKYSFAGLSIFERGIVMDGLNEKGLSMGMLWFPDGEYPDTTQAAPSSVLAYTDLGSWLLGNFETVDEVKRAFPKINVYGFPLPEMENQVAVIHVSLHDSNGKSLVIEFAKGKANLYDNEVGVLTNAPEFPWHVTNLRNFISLSAVNAGELKVDGTVLKAVGQGSGLLGIPGDWTPPSRFVRAFVFKDSLSEPKSAVDAVTAAFHLLNTVDIPYGAVRGAKTEDFDFTQWVVVKDLSNYKIYIRTYGDQNIQMVNLGPIKQARTISLGPTSPHRL